MNHASKAILSSAILVTIFAGPSAMAHGSWAHVQVTGWAMEALPAGELRDLLTGDPEVFNAALFGAAFTDSGYAPIGKDEPAAHAYGEHTHWESFVQDFVDWIRANDPPPWTDLESRKRVAFLMGCAAHGMQDEIFDSLFLFQAKEHDAGGQHNADPAMDGFLKLDGLLEFVPTAYIPMDTVLELYAGLSHKVTADVIQQAVDLMIGAYINDELGLLIAQSLGEQYEPEMPWTRLHYMDPEIPGSLASEIPATAGYMEAIWDRLHGTFDPDSAVIHTYPDPDDRILGNDAESPDSWVTLVYGAGAAVDSLTATWVDTRKTAVDYTLKGTRWGAHWTRLHRLQPGTSLVSGEWYTVELAPGLEFIDGAVTTKVSGLRFQAACGESGDLPCPDTAETNTQADPSGPWGPGCSIAAPGRSVETLWLVAGLFLIVAIRRRSATG
ncbi:MAG: hypothetical protein ISR64_07160 [Deltaproteobacteria bacterium]|nr:hypothetical protein [Deltaproteobacteria bacterium]